MNVDRTMMTFAQSESERGLEKTRWFDYRGRSVEENNDFFYAEYCRIYRDVHAQAFDCERGPQLPPREDHALCLARQAADGVGCRYDFYVRTAMNSFLRKGFSRLPMLLRLADEEIVMDVQAAWVTLEQTALQFAQNPRFTNDAWVGAPEQVAYHDYLIQQIKRRPNPHFALAEAVFVRKQLPKEFAAQAFGINVVTRAEHHFLQSC